jgi:quercetin dioxygenase-like cupin family protein
MHSLLGLLLLACLAQDGAPPKVQGWAAQELTAIDADVARKARGARPSFTVLTRTPTSVAAVLHRARTGEAELHEEMGDYIIVRAGTGKLLVGGELVNSRNTGKGEYAAESIRGGEVHSLAPGDVVHVPPKTPHQVVLAPGEFITYLLIKAAE